MLLPIYYSTTERIASLSNPSPCSPKSLLQIKEWAHTNERHILERQQIPFDINKAMQEVDKAENSSLCQILDTYLQQRNCPFCASTLSNHNTRCRACGWRK